MPRILTGGCAHDDKPRHGRQWHHHSIHDSRLTNDTSRKGGVWRGQHSHDSERRPTGAMTSASIIAHRDPFRPPDSRTVAIEARPSVPPASILQKKQLVHVASTATKWRGRMWRKNLLNGRSCSAQPELARQDEKYTGCSTVSARRGSRVSTRPSRVQRQTSRRRCWWVVVGKWTFVCLGAAKRHIRSSDSRVRDEPVPWFLEGRARISRRSRRCGRSGRSSSS
jgi:hypothetical protein